MDRPPARFDEDEAYAWRLRVLEHGLPDLPSGVAKGESVPVARWAGPEFGAVLRVEWRWGGSDLGIPDELDSIVQVCRRTATGWEDASGDGGGSWFDPPFQRRSRNTQAPSLFHLHGSGGEGWRCAARYGVVGPDVVTVELVTSADVISRTVESPMGAVVVAFDPTEPSSIRLLDLNAVVIESVSYEPDGLLG